MFLRAACFGFLLAVTPVSGGASTGDFAEQRPLFKAALAAIDKRDALRVAGLTLALGDYPLIDYLHYRWLRERLRDGEQLDVQIRDYLTYYPGNYAERLRGAWAQQLAEQQRWRSLLLAVRPETSDAQRCLTYRALFASGQRPSWEPPLRELWSRVGGIPEACDEVMQALLAVAPPGEELVWKRVASAIDKRRLKTAEQMAKYLSAPNCGCLPSADRARHCGTRCSTTTQR
jgi:hypothetical protein